MSEQDHLETIANRAARPCPKCAALESEIARLKEVVDWAGEILARHAGVEAEAGEENADG